MTYWAAFAAKIREKKTDFISNSYDIYFYSYRGQNSTGKQVGILKKNYYMV